MPRPTFPHTLRDLTHAIDGPFRLVVGDMPDGSIWVLQRGRATGAYTLTCWADARRTERRSTATHTDRVQAIHAMADAIGLTERLGE